MQQQQPWRWRHEPQQRELLYTLCPSLDGIRDAFQFAHRSADALSFGPRAQECYLPGVRGLSGPEVGGGGYRALSF